MLTLLTILSKGSNPYWNMFKRSLAEKDIAPLTIIHAPNLIGHPVGIALLVIFGQFVVPHDPLFFVYWSALIIFAAIVNVFLIFGLLHTKFFTTQVIGSLGFVSSSICAAIFLNERLDQWTIVSLSLAVVGVALFSWKRHETKLFSLDRGMVFTILAVLLGGFMSTFYKLATFHVSSYAALLTGRFITDLIGWTIIWLVSMWIIRRNPWRDLSKLTKVSDGQIFVIGTIVTTAIDSWLFYKLPVTTISLLGTIAFPVMYFISYLKYKERITFPMWLGTLSIISSIVLFLLAK